MLGLTYHDRDGRRSQRRVEPLRLVSWGRRWYLVAFDLTRNDWRSFRVDRLTLEPTTGHRFTPRPVPGDDIAAFVTARVATPWTHTCRIRFRAPAEQIAPGVSPSDGLVESDDESTCIATLNGHDPDLLAAYLGMFCVDFDVLHADRAVIRGLRRLHKRLSRVTT
jgi:predicted DNA-binding transcriptional regulator YafY